MPLPRMTTRRWMFAVAVVAAICARWTAIRMDRERGTRLARSAYFERERALAQDKLQWSENKLALWQTPPTPSTSLSRKRLQHLPLSDVEGISVNFWRKVVAKYRARTSWAAALRDKYDEAARCPWLAVPLDPPSPK